MQITWKTWLAYIDKLRKVDDKATAMVEDWIESHGFPQNREQANQLIDFAYFVSEKYGEAAATLAARMYDEVAQASKAKVPPAIPGPTPEIGEVAKTINGTLKTGNKEIVSSSVGRLVKRTGVDTTQQNALRDGAEWAWIPHGDTCAFCITLASRGWQRASKNALKNGHAEHIHANCDCTYAIRFDSKTNVEGYNPDKYLEMYENADGFTPKAKINALRREFYAENKAAGNNGKDAEEANVSSLNFMNALNMIQNVDEGRLKNISKNWYYNLPMEEQAAALSFDTYNFTRDSNREKEIKTLENALGKFRLPGNIKTYRGIGAEEVASLLNEIGVDGLITKEMKGTSINESRAVAFAKPRGGWIVEYDIKPGRKGAYFDGGVPGTKEQQFVINRKIKYFVKSIDAKKKRIFIDVG